MVKIQVAVAWMHPQQMKSVMKQFERSPAQSGAEERLLCAAHG